MDVSSLRPAVADDINLEAVSLLLSHLTLQDIIHFYLCCLFYIQVTLLN